MEIVEFLKSLVLSLRTSDLRFVKTGDRFKTQRIPFELFHEYLSSTKNFIFRHPEMTHYLGQNRRGFKVWRF